MKLTPSLRIISSDETFPILEINHPTCHAQMALHGAHVMTWQPKGHSPVLYLSPSTHQTVGTAIRGGIPICWPWFNAHPSDASQPSHGIARTQMWELIDAQEGPSGVTLTLQLNHLPWSAKSIIHFGSTLEVTLISHNPSSEILSISGALHTYLQVSDIAQIEIQGLESATYLDTVGTVTQRKQDGVIKIDQEVDRIYHSDTSVQLIDHGLKRTIQIEKSGSPSTVIWNPWEDKSKKIKDLPDADFHHFVCIEAAIANLLAISLKPNQSHQLSTKISIS